MGESNPRKMTRKELLAFPYREWDEVLHGVRGVYVLPSRRKHESGWSCMDFVAEFEDDRAPVRFGGPTDDVSFAGTHFRMDCTYPHNIIHIWCAYGRTFTISAGISSLTFTEEADGQ